MDLTESLALAVVAVAHLGAGVVVFLMVTRRGWWRRTEPETDWSTTAGCSRCNEHGPYPGWTVGTLSDPERARDLHQAWHEIAETLLSGARRLLRIGPTL